MMGLKTASVAFAIRMNGLGQETWEKRMGFGWGVIAAATAAIASIGHCTHDKDADRTVSYIWMATVDRCTKMGE